MYELYLPEVVGSTGNPSVAQQIFTAVNCSGLTKANGYLKIDLKCDVPANLSTSNQIEISSSESVDTNEWWFCAPTSEITTSYKTFELPLSSFGTAGGELDVTDIKRVRWYGFSTNGDITISWRNAYMVIRLTPSDSISIADSLIKNVTEQLSEAFSIVDSKVTKISKALSEAFSAIDSWVAGISFNESFSIADSLVKNGIKNLAEAFQTVDSKVRTAFLYLYELLSVKDSFKRFFHNLYTKITKGLSTYTKVDKDTSVYTKVDKSESDYTKKDRERGEE